MELMMNTFLVRVGIVRIDERYCVAATSLIQGLKSRCLDLLFGGRFSQE